MFPLSGLRSGVKTRFDVPLLMDGLPIRPTTVSERMRIAAASQQALLGQLGEEIPMTRGTLVISGPIIAPAVAAATTNIGAASAATRHATSEEAAAASASPLRGGVVLTGTILLSAFRS